MNSASMRAQSKSVNVSTVIMRAWNSRYSKLKAVASTFMFMVALNLAVTMKYWSSKSVWVVTPAMLYFVDWYWKRSDMYWNCVAMSIALSLPIAGISTEPM